jgi:hypothetical protein
MDRGGVVDPATTPNAIAAGPNLVSWTNASAPSAVVNIPDGDDNVNRLVSTCMSKRERGRGREQP